MFTRIVYLLKPETDAMAFFNFLGAFDALKAWGFSVMPHKEVSGWLVVADSEHVMAGAASSFCERLESALNQGRVYDSTPELKGVPAHA